MSRVQVSYTVPIEVVVDTDTRMVERVVVIDEGIRLDPEQGFVDSDPDPVAQGEAVLIAEASGEWPGWEHGW